MEKVELSKLNIWIFLTTILFLIVALFFANVGLNHAYDICEVAAEESLFIANDCLETLIECNSVIETINSLSVK